MIFVLFCLFLVKSFILVLSKSPNPVPFFLVNFVWKSIVPTKVKAFAWLVVYKKVNTNDLLQVRRPYKSLSPHWCILCKGNGETTDHLFLHSPLTLGLWHMLFRLAHMDWVPPRNIRDMMIISFRGLGNSLRDKTLWQITCLTIIWIVWHERNVRTFEEASCSVAFKEVPLNFFD